MSTGFFSHQGNQVNQLSYQLPDQGSSSSWSTAQSNQELSGSSEGNIHEQYITIQYGTDRDYKMTVEAPMKTVLTLGSSEASFLPSKVDYSHSIDCVPFPYADPYFGGVLAGYGSRAIIHPQIAGVTSAVRVPLPLEPAADEPIYVNAKQHAAILRRRQLRAKLEAQNKVIRARKPYLHESRHLRAMKRARGSGGRFLNTKQLQQQQQAESSGMVGCPNVSSSKVCSGNDPVGSLVTSNGSKITTVSTSGSTIVQQDHLSFSLPNFCSLNGESNSGGGSMMGNDSEFRFPALR